METAKKIHAFFLILFELLLRYLIELDKPNFGLRNPDISASVTESSGLTIRICYANILNYLDKG